jgi:hypothetical protein
VTPFERAHLAQDVDRRHASRLEVDGVGMKGLPYRRPPNVVEDLLN